MEINRLSLVRRRANALREKYKLSVPINLDTIIDQKSIKVLYKENQVGIDGLCQLQRNPPRIILNSEITFEPRLRFTVAHEIGHICIPWHTGVDLCSLDDPYVKIQGQQMINTQELEANVFASELLMPTVWLTQSFELDTEDLSTLVNQISQTANTSIMACFYALENVLPAGNLFFVKNNISEFWKPFYSVNTNCFYISTANAIPFYDRTAYWKNEFQISDYQVIHYKIAPSPDISTLNTVYEKCNFNIENLLTAITGGNPISAIPYIDTIINTLSDKFYVVVKIGDVCFRHFHHPETAIRMHCNDYSNIDSLYNYIQDNFLDYGKMIFSSDSCMLWIKEHWRENYFVNNTTDPNQLLKIIVEELYVEGKSHYMLQSINGVISNINSMHKTASEDELYRYAIVRYETDPKYKEFSEHYLFKEYLSAKVTRLVSQRRTK